MILRNEVTNSSGGIADANASQSHWNALKAVLFVVLFFATFLSTLSSFILKNFVLNNRDRTPRLKEFFSLVSCFGAGVFLSTCLLDLLPDAIEGISKAETLLKHPIRFPLPEFCIGLGFLLILFLEQMILVANERNWIGDSETDRLLAQDVGFVVPTRSHSHEEADNESIGPADAGQGDDPHFNPQSHSTIRVLLLVFALSLHAIFEGLSIGILTDVSLIFQIFAALSIHKLVVGFSLGVRLVQTRLRPFSIVLCCAIFSAQTLIGGFIGLAIVDIMSEKSTMFLVSGILQAVACGTFLYITTFEVLPHELAHGRSRLSKMLSLMIGFALITTFIAIFPD